MRWPPHRQTVPPGGPIEPDTATVLLTATLIALLAGPPLYALAKRQPALLTILDGFVLVSITGLVLVEVLPEAFAAGGALSLLWLLLGMLGPTALEHSLTRARRTAHLLALLVAVIGLILHSLGDGAALASHLLAHADGSASYARSDALGLAIAIHSIPVGLMVWWLLYPVFGVTLPTLALIAMCVGRIVGYHYAVPLSGLLGAEAWAWFQAFIAGSILHVIFGRPHIDDHAEDSHNNNRLEAFGNLAALGLLVWLAISHATPHDHGAITDGFGERLLQLSLEAAPALLLAYLIGGILGRELPQRSLDWLARGGRVGNALRGMLVGLPLPICSCGVLPLYRSLIQRGVPAPAATAFLLATPEVGLTALLISFPLLGAPMTLVRVAAAAVLAVVVAAWIASRASRIAPAAAAAQTCCGGCGHEPSETPAAPSRGQRLRGALRYGLMDLVDDTAAWIIAGVLLAALAMPYVELAFWQDWPTAVEVLLFAALGIPIYVCAAGATPLVAVLIAGGVSPGAAIAFLLTGPATNLSTFGVLKQLHGGRYAVIFATATAAGAIGLGWLTNLIADTVPLIPGDSVTPHHTEHSLWQWGALIALGTLYLGSLLRKGGRGLLKDLTSH